MAGTKVLAGFVPDFDATVVARLEAAGAVILGKLVLCEGAFGPYFPGLQVTVPFPSIAVRWIYHRKVAAKHTMEPRWTYGHAGHDHLG